MDFDQAKRPSFFLNRLCPYLFNVGHIEFLKRAREMGDYLLVGIHDDQTVNAIKGVNYPLMNLHERVLSVLACRVSLYLESSVYGIDDRSLEGGLLISYCVSLILLVVRG